MEYNNKSKNILMIGKKKKKKKNIAFVFVFNNGKYIIIPIIWFQKLQLTRLPDQHIEKLKNTKNNTLMN